MFSELWNVLTGKKPKSSTKQSNPTYTNEDEERNLERVKTLPQYCSHCGEHLEFSWLAAYLRTRKLYWACPRWGQVGPHSFHFLEEKSIPNNYDPFTGERLT